MREGEREGKEGEEGREGEEVRNGGRGRKGGREEGGLRLILVLGVLHCR